MDRKQHRDTGERPDELSFCCPSCEAVLHVAVSQLGSKVACSRCGQRVQLPNEHKNKTILLDPASLTRVGAVPSRPDSAAQASDDSTSASAGFYVIQEGVRTGPVSLRDLQSLADRGALKPTDMVLPEIGRAHV